MRRLTTSSRDWLRLNSITCAGVVIFTSEGRSCAAVRPQAKAALLKGTETPFSSMALRMAASLRGTWPFCQAKPSMNILVAMESPSRLVAILPASTKSTWSAPQALVISACEPAPGNCQSGFLTKAAVDEPVELMAAKVRPSPMRDRASRLAVTIRSQPMTRSALPVPTRVECRSDCLSARRTCDITGPPFWARPLMSSTMAPLPSTWAAMARIWPTVTTPVPPMPVIRMPYGSAVDFSTGAGSTGGAASAVAAAAFFGFFRAPPSTVTKLGQKPVTQEKSLLQEDWLIWRLRPSSVSSGSTERQFDCTEQSPQPSQTASLMTARLAGSGYSLFFFLRRFSDAQVWSWIMADTPGQSRNSRCTAVSSLRWRTVTPSAHL